LYERGKERGDVVRENEPQYRKHMHFLSLGFNIDKQGENYLIASRDVPAELA
jgi:hypothetical protein